MTRIWRYRIHLYLRNAIWVVPVLAMVAGVLTASALHELEAVLGWESRLQPEAARTVVITLASSLFTFIVFVSSTMLLALQLASAQLTPRAIAIVFRDPVAKLASAIFVFTFTFLVAVAIRLEESVPLLTARLASYSCMVSLGVFFYLIGHMGKALRPSELLRRVALDGRHVIESVYPHSGPRTLSKAATAPADRETPAAGVPYLTVAARADGVLLACDVVGIVRLAQRTDCVVELVPQIGDFVAASDPLFRVFAPDPPKLANELRGMVAVGHERTMEQDPAFAFRIIVDVACKALSPAINDPTTAILAIDQIHHLLRELGQRSLEHDRVLDASGRTRLLCRTPDWEDFVRLAVTEIRQYGRDSIQVTRRLRAMLENLTATLPADRVPPLRRELGLLHRSVAQCFADPEDQALADASDPQGMGGTFGESLHASASVTHAQAGSGRKVGEPGPLERGVGNGYGRTA